MMLALGFCLASGLIGMCVGAALTFALLVPDHPRTWDPTRLAAKPPTQPTEAEMMALRKTVTGEGSDA